jgi:UDP-N-acetylglucosamine--N-acetylmuramyl-(pentapeptide) pyrophosphoryl-undecaprenol N-acetylglucosamine transferase
VNRHAAILINDNEARQKLCAEAIRLIRDEELCKKLRNNISMLALRNSAEAIADEIIALARQ